MKNTNTKTLTRVALLVAIEVVMKLVGLGSVPMGPLYMSFLTLPIAVGAITMGPAVGALLGGVFGAVSFYDAITGASAMTGALFQVSPLNTFILCVGMRVLMGLCCGLIFKGLQKLDKSRTWSYIVSAMTAPALNTLFFMGYIVLAFYGCDYVQNLVSVKGAANPFMFVVLLVGVQGVAEFLPISSSGHLSIAQNLLNIDTAVPEFFDVLLHLGTLGAVFVAYWQDIKDMIAEFFRGIGDLAHRSTPKPLPPARRLILLIILGTLPLFAVLPIRKAVQGLGDNMVFVGAALIVTGFLLFLCDRVRKGHKTERSATWLDALLVGVGQAVATLPGVSRSGMTITAGCFVGYERRFAVRFSFLLSIPAVLGANILSIKDAVQAGIVGAEVPMYLVGVAVAAVTGYLCIRLLKYIADKGRFGAFAYYCWAVGILTLVLQAVK